MATANPGSGPVSLFGESNKLHSKVNSFREVIERKKLEVRRVGKEMRSLIEKKEEAIIRELDAILEKVYTEMEKKKTTTLKVIGELEIRKREIDELLRKLNQTEREFPELSEAIEQAKREMDIGTIPNVKLTWRLEELKDCINRIWGCKQHILEYSEDTRYQLKWGKCERGKGNNQIYHPWGVATNPMNENIYVADNENHRIQIFSSEGEWIRYVKDNGMKLPQNILFNSQSIYIQCSKAILKLNDSAEKKDKSKFYDFVLRGICTDYAHIYVGRCGGMSDGMCIIALTLDLIEENRISLKTEFCEQNTYIRDISLSQELFYILLSETDFPIQAFSREGILARCVVKKDSINCAWYFCLDQQHNILVADDGDSKVKIFSNEGKLLTQFGEKGSEKGQFNNLLGISVDEFGSIITVSRKISHQLQFFTIID